MIAFKATETAGRVVHGDTPHGAFRVEWDADGNLLSEWIEIRDPSQPKPKPAKKPNTEPKPRRATGPGTWLYHLIQLVTFGKVRHGLECERRRGAMDKAGWRGLPALIWDWATGNTEGNRPEAQ